MKKYYKLINFIIAVILVVLIVIMGRIEASDEVKMFDVYCNDINEGVYPDYKGLNDQCKNVK